MKKIYNTGHKICPVCGEEFYRDEEWKITCTGCYFAAKNATSKVFVAEDYLKKLRAQATDAEYWHNQYRNAVRKAEQERTRNDVASIIADILPQLLFFSHPDRNNNSIEATCLTATLLDLRRVLQ